MPLPLPLPLLCCRCGLGSCAATPEKQADSAHGFRHRLSRNLPPERWADFQKCKNLLQSDSGAA